MENSNIDFESLPDFLSFSDDPELVTQIATQGIMRELLTVNDEINPSLCVSGEEEQRGGGRIQLKPSGQLFDGLWSKELIEVAGHPGVLLRIKKGYFSIEHNFLGYYFGKSGVHQNELVIDPWRIFKAKESLGVELGIVKKWYQNAQSKDVNTNFYVTNYWELINHDAFILLDRLRKGQLAFQGTHDLSAHIVGLRKQPFARLQRFAQLIWTKLSAVLQNLAVNPYKNSTEPMVAEDVLIYLLGVTLDELAQPNFFGDLVRENAVLKITSLLESMSKNYRSRLKAVPDGFALYVDTIRSGVCGKRVDQTINYVLAQLQLASVV